MNIHMNLKENSYDILIERGALRRAGEYLNLNRRVLVVTDDGVPAEYAQEVARQCRYPVVCTVACGEGSKGMEGLGGLLQAMLVNGFSRKDCVVAIGGGVVGDLSGFAAAVYMRGIDFYNIPTTLLSQIDSSIGGKTAINFNGVKNVVGAFHQPKGVVVDPDLLGTLPARQVSNGLAEAVKMALTSDAALFDLFENGDISAGLEEIIVRSLQIKKAVVEQDERENGIRKILNFGHTIGHGIESAGMGELYHGECVALGMLPMCGEKLQTRVKAVLEKCGLDQKPALDWERIARAMFHDKKANGDTVDVTMVFRPGEYEMKTLKCTDVIDMAKKCLKG